MKRTIWAATADIIDSEAIFCIFEDIKKVDKVGN